MTELQMGLIGLGVATIAGVLAYNKWQEYRHRKLAERVLRPQHEDALFGVKTPARRSEPVFKEALQPDGERLEPVMAGGGEALREENLPFFAPEALEDFSDEEEADPGEVPAQLLDPRMDFIVVMELVEPVAAHQILRSQHEALTRIAKPVRWVGLNERSQMWETLLADGPQAYRRLRIGLQLADRCGPLGEADLTVFVSAMQKLADDLMAVADMPSTRVMDQAIELDRFCADVDMEIGINLISRNLPFAGSKIRALAEAEGLILGDDGLFTRRDEAGRILFALQNYESTLFSSDSIKDLSTHGLTFLLDVPRVAEGEQVFRQMADTARRFAQALQGALVDDNRQPLGEAQLDHIRREYIAQTQARMAHYGMPAGGAQALRLFS